MGFEDAHIKIIESKRRSAFIQGGRVHSSRGECHGASMVNPSLIRTHNS